MRVGSRELRMISVAATDFFLNRELEAQPIRNWAMVRSLECSRLSAPQDLVGAEILATFALVSNHYLGLSSGFKAISRL